MMVPLVLLASPDPLAALDLPDLRVIAVLPALPVPQALTVMMVLQAQPEPRVPLVLPELASLDQLARPEQPEPLVRLVPLVLPALMVMTVLLLP